MPVGHQDDFWGVSESIQGQLGSVCVFNDGIHEQHGYMLNSVGRFVVVWCNCIDTWCSQCVVQKLVLVWGWAWEWQRLTFLRKFPM